MPSKETSAVQMASAVVSNRQQFKSLWKLGGLTPGKLGRRVVEQIIADNVFGRAAELAFYFLFALFPLILLMVTFFGLFASNSLELRNDLVSSFAIFFHQQPSSC